MPRYEIVGPDGNKYEITAPDGTSEEDLVSVVQSQIEQPKSILGRAATAVSNVARNVAGAIEGPQDPANADLPVYQPRDVSLATGQARAKTVAIGDEAYADILKTQLGDRFVRMDRDANQYPILVYRGDDGLEKREYVNRPGLDFQDVDRGLSFAAPYLAAGGIASKLAPAGRAAGALAQGGTAAAVSGGQDFGAIQMGSEQGLDVPRAALAGVAGGASQVLPPWLTFGALGGTMGALTEGSTDDKIAGAALGFGTGALGGRGLQRATRGRSPESHLKDGKLSSAESIQKARNAGLNPDEMTPEDALAFARGITMGKDEVEVATAIQTNKFGIPTTKGQRTKDAEFLAVEKDLRAGTGGEQAKGIMQEFDTIQARELQASALQRSRPFSREPIKGDPYTEGVGSLIAPTRQVFAPEQATPGQFGGAVGEGLRAAKTSGDKAISKAWEGLDDILPKQQAFAELPRVLQARVGDLPIDDVLTPAASRMIAELDQFTTGAAPKPQSGLLRQPAAYGLDQMRRRLLAMKDGAANNTDRAASKAIYNAFDDWMDDIADKGMIAGRAEDVVRFRTARAVTREVKDLFAPKGQGGTQSPEGRILQRMTAEDTTPETIVSELFGAAGPTVTPKPGAVAALSRIKSALFGPKQQSQVGPLVEQETAERVWNDIRMAYWSRLVINRKGQMETPTMTTQNIRAAMRNQSSVMQALYSPTELRVMREYMRAVGEAAYKDPNPSGTATTLRTLLKRDDMQSARSVLAVKQKRATFSQHNFWMARFYQILTKKLPMNVFQTKEAIGAMVARRAVDQNLTPKAPPTRGGVGAGVAGAVSGQRQEPPRNAMRDAAR